MACGTFFLRTNGLTGADPGGTWSVVSGTYSGPALSGDNPGIDIGSNITLGQSVVFRYSGLDCDGTTVVSADVEVFNMDLGEITSFSETLCNNGSAVNIFSKLSGRLGAQGTIVWSGNITNPGFSGAGTTAQFNPSASGTGTFTFTATINPNPPGGYTDLGCCDPISATYTVTVNNAFNPGTGGSVAGC